jgi:signal transduction histidine kinase
MTCLLIETELTPLQREYAGLIRSSGESMLAVINDILDFSKIEAGRIELERIDFELHALLEEICEFQHIKAKARNLEFAYVNERIP